MTEDKQCILIVEDDEAIASGLALNLRLEGFTTVVVNDGEAALATLQSTPPNLVLLDISLPRMSGLDVLSFVRATNDSTPIIVLSARQDESDKVAALRLGADDYVTKPFGVAELLARIEAVLRRARPATEAEARPPEGRIIEFADVRVDLDARQVIRAGEAVALTHLEFELVTFLAAHPGKVLSRQELLREVWGIDRQGTPRTVDNFIGQLRAKLEKDPNSPRHIVTVRGSGYRFVP